MDLDPSERLFAEHIHSLRLALSRTEEDALVPFVSDRDFEAQPVDFLRPVQQFAILERLTRELGQSCFFEAQLAIT